MADVKKHEIVYGSDPQPGDHVLKHLAVFYDKIYLPHPYGLSSSTRVLWSNWEMKFQDDRDYGQDHFRKWKERNQYLFDAGIVETLPDVFDEEGLVGDEVGRELSERFNIVHLENNYVPTKEELINRRVRINKGFILNGRLAMALHYAYGKNDTPHLVWGDDIKWNSDWEALSKPKDHLLNDDFTTDNIRNQLISQLLSSESNMLIVSDPDKVLKLREKYKDEREAALMYYMNELSDKVRQHLRDGAVADEAAKRALESEVFPKIAEFKRKRNLTIVKRFSNFFGEILNVDAAPMTPKFFFQLSKALFGISKHVMDEKTLGSSNRSMSFRLLAKIMG